MGGIVVSSNPKFSERLKSIQINGGNVASPFDSWLILRGIRTLSVRMERHSKNAVLVAQFLETHPAVECVEYPGLPSHPGHLLASRQVVFF